MWSDDQVCLWAGAAQNKSPSHLPSLVAINVMVLEI